MFRCVSVVVDSLTYSRLSLSKLFLIRKFVHLCSEMNNKSIIGIGVIMVGVSLLMLSAKRKKDRSKPRWHERPHIGPLNRSLRGQQVTLNVMRIHDPELFFKTLRFLPEDFDKLLRLVGVYIIKDETRREVINPATRLAMTLRFLATGESQSSIALNYLIGAATAHKIIKETTLVIWTVLQPIVMPVPNKELFEEIADGFWKRWDVPNCCGSLDGKLIRIKMPPFSGSDYFCYKGFHAMILLGLCDHRYRFVIADFGAKGRASDGGVFSNSTLGRKMKARTLDVPPPKYVHDGPFLPHFFLGDEAFGLSENLFTPYPGRSSGTLNYTQQIFNYRQSRGRRIIENVFGIYASTWRIFKTEIDADVELIERIVMSTVCLHNFRIMLNDERSNKYLPKQLVDHEVNGTVIPGTWRDEIVEFDQIKPQSGRHSSAAAVQYRNDLADFFITTGSVPWQHKMISK